MKTAKAKKIKLVRVTDDRNNITTLGNVTIVEVNKNASFLDTKVNSLQPGQSVVISECSGIVCSAERSGDGKTLRFVRTFANGSFEVFRTTSF